MEGGGWKMDDGGWEGWEGMGRVERGEGGREGAGGGEGGWKGWGAGGGGANCACSKQTHRVAPMGLRTGVVGPEVLPPSTCTPLVVVWRDEDTTEEDVVEVTWP